jgi:hypothetical protein
MDDRDLKTRLRDWVKTEKEKILGIRGTKKKTAYIWEYYKLWIIGLIFVLWFVPFAIHQYRTNAGDYWCYMMFTNTYADAGNGSDLWKDYTEYAEFDLKEKDVEFNAESYFDYLKGVTGNSYFEAFVAFADGGVLDGITAGTDSLTALGRTGRLKDLNSEECAAIKAKYEDRFVYSVPIDTEYSTDPVPVGIDISDSKLVTKYGVYAEPCALGIGALSENVDSVELFLDFIFDK